MMGKIRQLHAIVHGRVQGVFFRDTTRKTAKQLQINGWVRNLRDGTVEVTAVGTPEQLESLLDFLHKGPNGAHVTQVDANILYNCESFDGFRIIHSF